MEDLLKMSLPDLRCRVGKEVEFYGQLSCLMYDKDLGVYVTVRDEGNGLMNMPIEAGDEIGIFEDGEFTDYLISDDFDFDQFEGLTSPRETVYAGSLA